MNAATTKKASTGGARRRKQGETRVAGSERALKLPHEHDESAEPPGTRQPVIEQAATDIAAGLVDTDNYTRAAAIAARAPRRRRRDF